VVALPGDGEPPPTFALHPSPMLVEHRLFRWTARRGVGELLDRLGIDAVMERYYNFAGEGVRAASQRGIPVLLEVNAPLKEHPGSWKRRLDTLAVVRPMRRLRDAMCAKASAIVTPLVSIIPDDVPREKIHRVTWGANVEHFRPDVDAKTLSIPDDRPVVVFSGSFRPWHGADVLVRAAAKLPEVFFLFLGDGPSLQPTRELATELGVDERVLFTGAVAYEAMPGYVKRATIGAAPYQPGRLGQMQLGFFWSPLKIFEYMAMGLPVVSLDAAPLREIVRPSEGVLVAEGDVDAWVDALRGLVDDPAAARAKGLSGRERVVAEYSWQRHCEQLERILINICEAVAA
jgi:starch synthase